MHFEVNWVEIAFLTSFLICIFLFYISFLKKTVFGIDLANGHYSGFFILYNFLISILPSALLLNTFQISNFYVAFKVKQDVVFFVTILILVSYFFYIFLLWIFYQIFPRFLRFEFPVLSLEQILLYRKFVVYSVVFLLFLILFVWLVFGIGHTFAVAIALDQNLSQGRMALSKNMATRFLKHLFIILPPFLMSIIASPVYKGKPIARLIFMVCVLFLGSWGGNKGTFLNLFLVYFVIWATFSKLKPTFFNFFKFCFLVFILLIIVQCVVLIQYPYMTKLPVFFKYLYQRVFVAQMIGVYEQFSLHINNIRYFLHGIPFASFFIDYPIFHKDLMMITEDRVNPSIIGIKNTFFIAEAYAIGGWFFILPSIFIYALNFSLSYMIVVVLLNKFLGLNFSFNKLITAVWLFSYINVTGGFSDLMLFKITIMIALLLFPFFLLGYLSRYKLVVSKRENHV